MMLKYYIINYNQYKYYLYMYIYIYMGSMVQWDNRKLISQTSRIRLQAVLVFLLCLSRT